MYHMQIEMEANEKSFQLQEESLVVSLPQDLTKHQSMVSVNDKLVRQYIKISKEKNDLDNGSDGKQCVGDIPLYSVADEAKLHESIHTFPYVQLLRMWRQTAKKNIFEKLLSNKECEQLRYKSERIRCMFCAICEFTCILYVCNMCMQYVYNMCI